MEMPVEKKESKTGAIIGTIVAVLLCGCPGLVGLCLGATSLIAGFIPGAAIDVFGSSDPRSAMLMGVASLCGGIIFIAIPIVVGILTLRKKKALAAEEILPPSEPLPPAA
ncbi:MAG: hypothetical protein AUK02_08140 [Anaerolineae bacterium CG2_30_58_95]|nr:MAG: hypothetical protein AUK02_08140 [Anaerolineae bacterium CG2_30_58_95]